MNKLPTILEDKKLRRHENILTANIFNETEWDLNGTF